MPLDPVPQPADKIIVFDGTPGVASKLNYNVPQPGHHDGRRVLKLYDLGLTDTDWTEEAKVGPTDLAEEMGLDSSDGTESFSVDPEKAVEYWIKRAGRAGVPGDEIAAVERLVDRAAQEEEPILNVVRRASAAAAALRLPNGGAEPPLPGVDDVIERQGVLKLGRYIKRLEDSGVVMIPQRKWGGGVAAEPVQLPVNGAAAPEPEPALFLVEVYGVSSFLGDYGLGRTIKTFTLLPGEELKISTKTWTSTETKQADASSIVDSFSQTAADKFRTAVQKETTDKKTQASKESWHVEAEVNAEWGWGNAKVSGGGAGEYHSGREEFAKQVDDSVQEHANEASSKRETTVTSSAETLTKSGEETVTERIIKNVNLRRTLNFVFRQLNQQYETKMHLKDVRVAFTNGLPDTWREVSLAGLRGLLTEVLDPSKVDEVAQKILKLVSVIFDEDDEPVPVLEKFTLQASGQDWQKEYPATTDADGEYPAPDLTTFYRFKRGALSQDDMPVGQRVAGVVMKKRQIVLPSDSMVVEALLGQADALDAYAIEAQRAEAEAKGLDNEREKIAQSTLKEIKTPEKRAEAYDDMFNPETVLANGQPVGPANK